MTKHDSSKNQPTLFIMHGYPGSGRIEAARSIVEYTDALLLWADRKRLQISNGVPEYSTRETAWVYRDLDQQATDALRADTNAVYIGNSAKRERRQQLHSLARSCGARALTVWIQCDKAVARDRAADTEISSELTTVPSEMFNRQAGRYRHPNEQEPHVIVQGPDITPAAVTIALTEHSGI